MKKVLLSIVILLIFTGCNQSKVDELSTRVTRLQKDSLNLVTENKLLKSRLDSINNARKLADSLNLIAQSDEQICKCGKDILKLSSNMRAYAYDNISYSTVITHYQLTKRELEDIKPRISDTLYNKSTKLFIDYAKGVNDLRERGGYNEMSTNQRMGLGLFLEVWKVSCERVKAKLCNP